MLGVKHSCCYFADFFLVFVYFTFASMKKYVLACCLLIRNMVQAQTIKAYYDYKWNRCEVHLARFIALLTKSDSGWNREDYFISTSRLQMKGLYKDSGCKIKNGYFAFFHANGYLEKTGRYTDDKKDGLWMEFYNNGMLGDSGMYVSGHPTGLIEGWHYNGVMRDSITIDPDGNGVQVSWFDNGNPSEAGRLQHYKKQGRWQFFEKNGTLAAKEDYVQDSLTGRIYYDETGKPLADTTSKDRAVHFLGGTAAWGKYVQNHASFPYNYKLVNTDTITVIVAALIDEDGKVRDPYMQVPFSDVFDKEALRLFAKSPPWVPAINHNRKVATYVRQPVTFVQQ